MFVCLIIVFDVCASFCSFLDRRLSLSVVFTNKKIDHVYTSAYFIQSYQITDDDYALFFPSATLEIEMSIHDRITLAKGSGTFLFYSSKKKNTELDWNKEKGNNINNLLPAKPDIHVYVYKSICPHIRFDVSCIFDLKRRNYRMTCFMFIDNRLRDTDVNLIDIWTSIIVVVEFICRLNKTKIILYF